MDHTHHMTTHYYQSQIKSNMIEDLQNPCHPPDDPILLEEDPLTGRITPVFFHFVFQFHIQTFVSPCSNDLT